MKKKEILFILLFAFISILVGAQETRLLGSWTYTFDWTNSTVRIKGGSIKNEDKIYKDFDVCVVFTDTKYTGGDFNGYVVATKSFHIYWGETVSDVDFVVNLEGKLPESNYYYVSLLLTVYSLMVEDSVTWSNSIRYINKTDEKVEQLLSDLSYAEIQYKSYEFQSHQPQYYQGASGVMLEVPNTSALLEANRWYSKMSEIKMELSRLNYSHTGYPHKQYFAEKKSMRHF